MSTEELTEEHRMQPDTTGPKTSRAQVDAALDKIEGFVEAGRDHFGTPGVAVADVTRDTVFALASMSKPINTTAVAHLVAEEVIAWDAPGFR
jgi:CubicO group peptidase (beta-lactamase class C family)